MLAVHATCTADSLHFTAEAIGKSQNASQLKLAAHDTQKPSQYFQDMLHTAMSRWHQICDYACHITRTLSTSMVVSQVWPTELCTPIPGRVV